MSVNTQMNDQVVLVNELDQPIGVMDKIAAHRGSAQLHRAVSVFLSNEKGEWLLQQRSPNKIVGAMQWANACCGNVRPGESYEQCAYRRLREELGITKVELLPVYKFQYAVACNDEFSEREIDQLFVGKYEGTIAPNPAEVNAVKFVSTEQIKTDIASAPQMFAPWFEVMIEQKILTFL